MKFLYFNTQRLQFRRISNRLNRKLVLNPNESLHWCIYFLLTDNQAYSLRTYSLLHKLLTKCLECKSKDKWPLDTLQTVQLHSISHQNLNRHQYLYSFQILICFIWSINLCKEEISNKKEILPVNSFAMKYVLNVPNSREGKDNVKSKIGLNWI